MSTPEDTVKGQPRKRRKITRSREGCLTCRRRRKLCSFDKPVCEACARLSLVSCSVNSLTAGMYMARHGRAWSVQSAISRCDARDRASAGSGSCVSSNGLVWFRRLRSCDRWAV